MNLYKNDNQEYVFAETPPSPSWWEVEMVRECDLPVWMKDEEIGEWLEHSQVVDGCRCGPRPESGV